MKRLLSTALLTMLMLAACADDDLDSLGALPLLERNSPEALHKHCAYKNKMPIAGTGTYTTVYPGYRECVKRGLFNQVDQLNLTLDLEELDENCHSQTRSEYTYGTNVDIYSSCALPRMESVIQAQIKKTSNLDIKPTEARS